MFNLKSLFRKGITADGAWIGNTIAGPTGGIIGGELAGSLVDKKIGGMGEFRPVNTAITAPKFSKMSMSAYAPGMAKKASSVSTKTVDADTLNAEWNYRLNRYLVTKRYYKT